MGLKIAIIISSWFVFYINVESRPEFNNYGDFRAEPYFVDKTEMLRMLFNDSLRPSPDKPYYLVTCPYNFGKMINSLMIKLFAEINLDGGYKPTHWLQTQALSVFKDLSTKQDPNLITDQMCKYPVIYMDLSIFKLTRSSDPSIMLKTVLQNSVLSKYPWLANLLKNKINTVRSDFNIDKSDAQFFISLFKNTTCSDEVLTDGLLSVCRLLYEYFNQTKIVLLVNDYDRIALEAFMTANKYGVQFYEKFNKMLVQALTKGPEYFKFALITGTGSLGFSTEMKKFNLFGFSFGTIKKPELFTHYSFLDEHIFTPYYGLLEEEIKSLCNSNKLLNSFENAILSECYCTVGGRKICNPGSVSDVFLKVTRSKSRENKFTWIDPEFNKLVMPFSRSKIFSEKMEEADRYGYFQYPIQKQFPPNSLKELIKLAKHGFRSIKQNHVDMFFTLCFEQGYFTHIPGKNNFTFPNLALKTQFKSQMSAVKSPSNYLKLINLQSVLA